MENFLANRVVEIQQLSNINRWFHVNSENSAADLITRGYSLNELVNCHIWCHDPQNFSATYDYDQQLISIDNIVDQKTTSLPVNINFHHEIFDRYSYLNTLE